MKIGLFLLGLLSGVVNYMLAISLIIPGLAIPFIAIFTLCDEEIEPKCFGVGYIMTIITTHYIIRHAV